MPQHRRPLLPLIPFLQAIRVHNLCIIALMQWVVRICLTGERNAWFGYLEDRTFWFLVLSTFFVGAAGYLINDYYDIKTDTINRRRKVIIGIVLRRRVALAANLLFNILALFFALLAGTKVFVFNFLTIFWLWFYSNRLKRLPFIGNLVLGTVAAAPVLVVAIAYPQQPLITYAFAVFSFGITLIRSLLKDMADLRGDMHFGSRTTPITYGIRKTKWLIYITLTILLVGSLSLFAWLNLPALWVTEIFIIPLASYFSYRLYWADTRKTYIWLSNMCKLILIGGIILMTIA